MRGQTVKGPWGTKTMQVAKITETAYTFMTSQQGTVRYKNDIWPVSREVKWDVYGRSDVPWEATGKTQSQMFAEWREELGMSPVDPTPTKRESVLPVHLRPEFDSFVLSILGRTEFSPHTERDFARVHWDPTATKEVWNPPTAGDIAKWIFAYSSVGSHTYYSSELGQHVTDPGWEVSDELQAVLVESGGQVWMDNAYLRRKWTTQVRSALTRLKKQGKVFTMTGYRKGNAIKEWALKEYER